MSGCLEAVVLEAFHSIARPNFTCLSLTSRRLKTLLWVMLIVVCTRAYLHLPNKSFEFLGRAIGTGHRDRRSNVIVWCSYS